MKKYIFLAAILLNGCAINQVLNQQGQDNLKLLQVVTDADISQARSWAFLNKDDAAMECLDAIQVVAIEARSMTVIGPMTAFQMGMDVTNPGGYLNIHCAAERAQVKARINLFIGSTATLLATFGL